MPFRKVISAAVAGLFCTACATNGESVAKSNECIVGTARMLGDRTVELNLRAEDSSGTIGHSLIRYSSDHPQYESILAHVGALAPGESVLVPCWPAK